MYTVRVSNWAELNEQLYEGSWNRQIRRFRSDFVFRGLGMDSYSLTTGLMRLGGNHRELEIHLLRNFRKYALRTQPRDDSEWIWLAMAQHHGLPTRMLDWTYSPFVAMHFATADLEAYDENGVIYCVNYVRLHDSLPAKLKRILRRERSNALTSQMLREAAGTLASLEKLARKDFVVFFEPPSLDERIVNQFALFSMMSSPIAQLDEWMDGVGKDVARRIVIPAKLKWEIRDKLDQANITERVLFPGLDGLCEWLKRHYTPRTAKVAQMRQEDARPQAKRSKRMA